MIDTLYHFCVSIWQWVKDNFVWVLGIIVGILTPIATLVTWLYGYIGNFFATFYGYVSYGLSDSLGMNVSGLTSSDSTSLVPWMLSFLPIEAIVVTVATIMGLQFSLLAVRAGISIYKLIPGKFT